MASDNTIKTILEAIAKTEGVDKMKSALNELDKTSAKTNKSFLERTESFSKKLNTTGKSIRNLGLGITALAAPAIAFGVKSVKAFQAAEVTATKLKQALKSQGGAWEKNFEALDNQAGALAKVTRFEDDYTKAAQAVLIQRGHEVSSVQELTPLMLGLAESTRDANGQTVDAGKLGQILSKALEGNASALGKLNVKFSDSEEAILKNGTAQERLDLVSGKLKDKFGDLATAAGQTLPGQMDILKNQWGEVQESFGETITTILTPLANEWLPKVTGKLGEIATWASENPDKVKTAVAAFSGIAGVGVGMTGLGLAINGVGSAMEGLVEGFEKLTSPSGAAVTGILLLTNSIRAGWIEMETFSRKGALAFEMISTDAPKAEAAIQHAFNDANRIKISDFWHLGFTSPSQRADALIYSVTMKQKGLFDLIDSNGSGSIDYWERMSYEIGGVADRLGGLIARALQFVGLKPHLTMGGTTYSAGGSASAPSAGAGSVGAHMAGGGHVFAGNAYTVNEGRETEAFVPGQSGSMVTEGQVNGGAGGASVSNSSTEINVYQENYINNDSDITASIRELGFILG